MMEVKEAIDRAKIIVDFYNRANAIYTLINIAKNKGEQHDN